MCSVTISVRCELVVVRMNVCDVVVVECCGVNGCVITGDGVEMTVVRLLWLVTL